MTLSRQLSRWVPLAFLFPLTCFGDPASECFKATEAEISRKFVVIDDHYYGCNYADQLFESTKLTYNTSTDPLSEIDKMNGWEWRGMVQFGAGPTRFFERASDHSKVTPLDWAMFPYVFAGNHGEQRRGKLTQSLSCTSTRRPTLPEMKLIAAATGVTLPPSLVVPGNGTVSDKKPTAVQQETDYLQKQDDRQKKAEADLNLVYTQLQKRADAQEKEQLKREELKWIAERQNALRQTDDQDAFIATTERRTEELKRRIP